MEETLTATQIAARIGISERTALRWIAEKKLPATLIRHGHYLVNSEDIMALVPVAYSQVIESRLADLERQIRALETRVGELENRPGKGAPVRTLRPAPIPYNVTSSDQDVISARSFAKAHGISRDRMENMVKAQVFPTTPVPHGVNGIIQSLTREQQAGVIAYWDSRGIAYTRCEHCPHSAIAV